MKKSTTAINAATTQVSKKLPVFATMTAGAIEILSAFHAINVEITTLQAKRRTTSTSTRKSIENAHEKIDEIKKFYSTADGTLINNIPECEQRRIETWELSIRENEEVNRTDKTTYTKDMNELRERLKREVYDKLPSLLYSTYTDTLDANWSDESEYNVKIWSKEDNNYRYTVQIAKLLTDWGVKKADMSTDIKRIQNFLFNIQYRVNRRKGVESGGNYIAKMKKETYYEHLLSTIITIITKIKPCYRWDADSEQFVNLYGNAAPETATAEAPETKNAGENKGAASA